MENASFKRCHNCFATYGEDAAICPYCGYAEGDPPEELFYLTPGTRLSDRYIIGKGIGCGGFGITYLAWDSRLEITVAVKEFYPGGLVNRVPGSPALILLSEKQRRQFHAAFSRFMEEAQSMAQFSSHNAIVNVFEYFEENQTAYIVMEYLQGMDLASYMGQHQGRCSLSDTLQIAAQLFDAVEAIHSKGILHRDIAPDNIMLTSPEHVKLFDFGAAKLADSDLEELMVIVKPGYSPVEQYNKLEKQGPWTDVYAIGAVLYHMLTGIKPDEATNRQKQLEESAYQIDTLEEPRLLQPQIPEQQSNAILKAMAVEPAFRFQSVAEFRNAFLGDQLVMPPLAERRHRKKRRSLSICLASAAAAVVLCAAGAGALHGYVPPSELTLWYTLSGDAELDRAKEQGLKEATEAFQSSFPGIKMTLTGIPCAQYSEMLTQAMAEDTAPDIFESSELSESALSGCIRVSDISADSLLNIQIDQEVYRLAIGWQASVLYQNITLSEPLPQESKILEISAAHITYEAGQHDVTVQTDGIGMAAESGPVAVDAGCPVITREDFTDRKHKWYLGTTQDYFAITAKIPGQVQCYALADTSCAACSTWSALDRGYRKNQGEKAFLEFLLSEQGQELLMVNNHSTALPLERHAWESYCEVYPDVFVVLSEEINNE